MSAMKLRLILLVGVLATAPMSANGDTSLTVTGAAGEFESRAMPEGFKQADLPRETGNTKVAVDYLMETT